MQQKCEKIGGNDEKTNPKKNSNPKGVFESFLSTAKNPKKILI
jgi:hypothetical protein